MAADWTAIFTALLVVVAGALIGSAAGWSATAYYGVIALSIAVYFAALTWSERRTATPRR